MTIMVIFNLSPVTVNCNCTYVLSQSILSTSQCTVLCLYHNFFNLKGNNLFLFWKLLGSMSVRSDQHIQRKFGCLKILWRIENFWLSTCKRNWEISSPEFSVSAPQLTSWKMVLKPKNLQEDVSGEYYLSVYLERLNSDPGPDIVRVNWKLSLRNCKRKRNYLFREMEHLFEKNHRNEETIESMNCLLNDFKPFELDDLHIDCQLIVSCYTDSIVFFKCSDKGLLSLSDDMLILFKSCYGSDVVIRIENEDILASKAILHARNSALASIIDQEPETRVIELLSSNLSEPSSRDTAETCLFSSSSINVDAVKRVVKYIYCGKLEEVISKPSVCLSECALLLDISEVIPYYIPDELILKSAIDVNENVFFWHISDFEPRNVNYMLSPPLTEGLLGSIWCLKLFPRVRCHDGEYVSLYAETFGERIAREVCLEFAVMDTDDNFYGFRRLQKSLDSSEILGFEDFIKRDCLRNAPFLKDGTLRIIFKIQTTTGVPSLSNEYTSVTSVLAPLEEHNFTLLSKDMADLFRESEFSDFRIHCGDEIFKVHSYIMMARSNSFHEILREHGVNENEIYLSNIKSNVLRILLSYMYSGTMEHLDVDIVHDVFSAACYFKVDALINACSRILADG